MYVLEVSFHNSKTKAKLKQTFNYKGVSLPQTWKSELQNLKQHPMRCPAFIQQIGQFQGSYISETALFTNCERCDLLYGVPCTNPNV